jgi:hypothetical protein
MAGPLATVATDKSFGHWHVQVEGQSESAVQEIVGGATHVFHVTARQLLAASQIAGIRGHAFACASASHAGEAGIGTSAHGTLVAVAYGGTAASYGLGPQS